ncbi:MAG: YdeI/OmpD-associated family protein [Bacteroidota bacterium]
MIQFHSKIELHDSNVWGHIVPIPSDHHQHLSTKNRRWLVAFNDLEFHSAASLNAQDDWFFLINKKRLGELGLSEGDPIHVAIKPDESPYGMDMPEEFEVLLDQDEAAMEAFLKLTPGKRRNLIYIVSQVKSPAIRLRRANVIAKHIVTQKASIDFKLLNQEIKAANQLAKLK